MALVTDLVLAPLVEHLKHVVRDQPGGKTSRPIRTPCPGKESKVCVGGNSLTCTGRRTYGSRGCRSRRTGRRPGSHTHSRKRRRDKPHTALVRPCAGASPSPAQAGPSMASPCQALRTRTLGFARSACSLSPHNTASQSYSDACSWPVRLTSRSATSCPAMS